MFKSKARLRRRMNRIWFRSKEVMLQELKKKTKLELLPKKFQPVPKNTLRFQLMKDIYL